MAIRSVRTVLVTLSLLCSFAQAHAQQPLTHCSNWLKGGAARTVLEHYSIGYLAGMSTIWDVQQLKPENPGGRIRKNADVFLYVDAHCRINDGDDVTVAVFKLFRELAGQK